jgi:hypothetical protein
MKHFLLFFALLNAGLSFAQGQGDVTIYSNTGDKFYVILNGVRQNDSPETNVKVTGLTNPYYSCKIISANNNFELEKNVLVKYDTLITYRIVEKKGRYKLRYLSEASLGTSTAQTNQTVVSFHATESAPSPREPIQTTTTGNTGNTGTTTITTTTSTTTGTTSPVQNTGNPNATTEAINMNISINENGMNTNLNVNANGTENSNLNTNMNTTESTTTTSTTSSNGSNTSYYEETTISSTSTGGNVFENNGTSETINASCNLSDIEAKELASQVENETFKDDQLRIANLAAKNKCLSTNQIELVTSKFTFDSSKLDFLKSAYDNCSDQSNYYKLMESLTYSGDKDELQKFIDSKR